MPESVEVKQARMTGGMWRVRQESRRLAAKVVEGCPAVGLDHGQSKIEQGTKHLDHAITVPGDEYLFPTALAVSLIPDAWAHLTVQPVPHDQRFLIRIIQIVVEQRFDLGTGLHGQPFPGLVLFVVGKQQMNRGIIESPLAMADLTGHLLAVLTMSRMA